MDTDALIERYKKEIGDLKQRLAEREKEAEAPARTRRLSTKEVSKYMNAPARLCLTEKQKADESKAMRDLNARIQQLTRLILTSQSVDDGKADDSRPASPVKIDFDMSPYQLQQELLAAKNQIESQETQILSLEAALLARPALPPTAPEHEKDNLIAAQAKTIRELEIVVRGYEDNLGEPLRKVKEDVENEWTGKLEEESNKREEQERWAEELVRQLDRERKVRKKLEDERRALAAFVSKFDSLGLGLTLPPSSSGSLRTPTKSGIVSAKTSPFADRKKRLPLDGKENTSSSEIEMSVDLSPMKMDWKGQQQLMMEQLPEETSFDVSFDCERLGAADDGRTPRKSVQTLAREVFGGRENTIVP